MKRQDSGRATASNLWEITKQMYDQMKYQETCPTCLQPARSEIFDDQRLSTDLWYFCINPKCENWDGKNLKVKGAPVKTEPVKKEEEESKLVCMSCGRPLSETMSLEDGIAYKEFSCRNLSCPKSHELAGREAA